MMFSIGDMSKRTGVKVPTIRYYEQMGLIEAAGRSRGNQRRYTKEGLEQLSFIKHARALGFAINDIRELAGLSKHPEKSCHDAHKIAARHLREVQARMAKLKRLEQELKRVMTCEGDRIGDCVIIETLADHDLCSSEH